MTIKDKKFPGKTNNLLHRISVSDKQSISEHWPKATFRLGWLDKLRSTLTFDFILYVSLHKPWIIIFWIRKDVEGRNKGVFLSAPTALLHNIFTDLR